MMDEPHVERILLNVLTNSIKYTPEGGHVTLETSVVYDGRRATHTYVIRDDGIGISEEFQKRMFLPFEQEEQEHGTREGTGLGLYICKNLLDMLGGRIRCRSRLGDGTEFTVTLQYELATDEQILLRQQKTATYEDRILYGKNILLAEDNRINAEVIMKFLHMKCIRAELARDGEEAVELFRVHGPYYYQAVLMDLMMPGKNGLEAAREIRKSAQEDALTIPVIALTADVTPDVEGRVAAAGMQHVIRKPIESEALYRCLAEEFQRQLDMSKPSETEEQ